MVEKFHDRTFAMSIRLKVAFKKINELYFFHMIFMKIPFLGFSDHTTVIYIGSHMDAGAELADIILPAVTYTEKSSTFVNLEGRPQRTRQVVNPPSE